MVQTQLYMVQTQLYMVQTLLHLVWALLYLLNIPGAEVIAFSFPVFVINTTLLGNVSILFALTASNLETLNTLTVLFQWLVLL